MHGLACDHKHEHWPSMQYGQVMTFEEAKRTSEFGEKVVQAGEKQGWRQTRRNTHESFARAAVAAARQPKATCQQRNPTVGYQPRAGKSQLLDS